VILLGKGGCSSRGMEKRRDAGRRGKEGPKSTSLWVRCQRKKAFSYIGESRRRVHENVRVGIEKGPPAQGPLIYTPPKRIAGPQKSTVRGENVAGGKGLRPCRERRNPPCRSKEQPRTCCPRGDGTFAERAGQTGFRRSTAEKLFPIERELMRGKKKGPLH